MTPVPPATRTRIHGLVSTPGGRVALRAPMLQAMWTLREWYPRAHARDPALSPPWAGPRALASVEKLKESWWKLNRACERMGELAPHLVNLGRPVAPPADALWAVDDYEMYADMLVIYLRLQADCIAGMFDSLYGEAGREASPKWRSFRGHLEWFSETNPTFDAAYASVARNERAWFDALAPGDPPGAGLRDGVVHGMARFAFSIDRGVDGGPRMALVHNADERVRDVPSEITRVMDGLMRYFDGTYLALLGRLGDALSPEDRRGFESPFHLRTSAGLLPWTKEHPALWAYPAVV